MWGNFKSWINLSLPAGSRFSATYQLAAQNVALKVLVASLLTDEELVIHNLPLLRDVYFMLEVLKSLGVVYSIDGHTVMIKIRE